MPCCGLQEHRQKVPLKYTVAGGAFFWGVFLAATLWGLATAWRAQGRGILRVQASFLRVLWHETMRQRQSMPSRWSCRLSGLLLGTSPKLARIVYQYPEVPLLYLPLGVLAALGVALVYAPRPW